MLSERGVHESMEIEITPRQKFSEKKSKYIPQICGMD